MKKFSAFMKSALLGAMAVMMVACGKIGSGDYRNIIPEDAFMTLSFNAQSLMDKAGLSDAERAAMKGQAEMVMAFMGGSLSADDKKFILSMIDSPDNSGVSFKNNIYLSMSGDLSDGEPDNVKVAVIGKISDSKKFGKLIDLVKTLDPNIETRSSNGLDIIILDESSYSTTVIAYDNNAVVLYTNQDDYPATVGLLSKLFKGTNSIADNKDLDKFTNAKSDISVLMNYGIFVDMVKDQIPFEIPYLDILSSSYIYSNTNFEKGKIDTDMGIVFTSDQARKEFEELYSKAKLNGKYAKYLSDNAIFAGAGYLEGGKIYETLLKLPPTSMIGFVPEAKKILEALDGEIFFSLTGVGRHGVTATMLATVTDPTVLPMLLEKIDGYVDITRRGDHYEIDVEGMEVAFGIKDDVLFISTDNEILAALDGNSVNAPEKDIVSMFSKGYGAFYVNFDNLADAILATSYGYVSSDTEMAIEFINLFNDLRMKVDNPKEVNLVITMDDQSKNAMASIADKIRTFVMAQIF